MAQVCNGHFSAEIRAYVNHSYDMFTKLVDKEISMLTRNIVRRRLKMQDCAGRLLIARVYLGTRHFAPNIHLAFCVRRHDVRKSCTCYVCRNKYAHDDDSDDDDKAIDFEIEFYVEIASTTCSDNCPDGVFRKTVQFEVTSDIYKISAKLRNHAFMMCIMNFFATHYPFDRCVSCKFEYAAFENMCYDCATKAVRYVSNGDKCCICLDTDTKMVCCKLPCGHIFHKLCYDRYSVTINGIDENTELPRKPKCPLCKAETDGYLIL